MSEPTTPEVPEAPVTTTAPLPAVTDPVLDFSPPPAAPEEDDSPVYEYAPTGDSGLDMALAYVGELGISGEDPAIVAAATGDFSALEAKLKELDPKGYERNLRLAKDSYARVKANAIAKEKPTADAVFAAVGGEENWKAILKWARENATDEERDQANKGIQAGPVAAAATASALRAAYIRKGGTLVGKSGLSPDAATAASANVRLSSTEYTQAITELVKKHGAGYARTDDYQQLRARVA